MTHKTERKFAPPTVQMPACMTVWAHKLIDPKRSISTMSTEFLVDIWNEMDFLACYSYYKTGFDNQLSCIAHLQMNNKDLAHILDRVDLVDAAKTFIKSNGNQTISGFVHPDAGRVFTWKRYKETSKDTDYFLKFMLKDAEPDDLAIHKVFMKDKDEQNQSQEMYNKSALRNGAIYSTAPCYLPGLTPKTDFYIHFQDRESGYVIARSLNPITNSQPHSRLGQNVFWFLPLTYFQNALMVCDDYESQEVMAGDVYDLPIQYHNDSVVRFRAFLAALNAVIESTKAVKE